MSSKGFDDENYDSTLILFLSIHSSGFRFWSFWPFFALVLDNDGNSRSSHPDSFSIKLHKNLERKITLKNNFFQLEAFAMALNHKNNLVFTMKKSNSPRRRKKDVKRKIIRVIIIIFCCSLRQAIITWKKFHFTNYILSFFFFFRY